MQHQAAHWLHLAGLVLSFALSFSLYQQYAGTNLQKRQNSRTAGNWNAGLAWGAGNYANHLQSITSKELQAVRDTLIGLEADTRLQNSINEELAST